MRWLLCWVVVLGCSRDQSVEREVGAARPEVVKEFTTELVLVSAEELCGACERGARVADEVELHRRAQQVLLDDLLAHLPGESLLRCMPTIGQAREAGLEQMHIRFRADVSVPDLDAFDIVRLRDTRDIIAIADEQRESVFFGEIDTEGPFLLGGKPAVSYTCRRGDQAPGEDAVDGFGEWFSGWIAAAPDGRLLVAPTGGWASCGFADD